MVVRTDTFSKCTCTNEHIHVNIESATESGFKCLVVYACTSIAHRTFFVLGLVWILLSIAVRIITTVATEFFEDDLVVQWSGGVE